MGNDLYSTLKKYKALIGIAIALLGVMSFAVAGLNVVNSIQDAPQEFDNWYDQLPQQHWMKTKKNEYDAFIQLLRTEVTLESTILPTLNFAGEALKQDVKFGDVLVTMLKREFENSKPKFILNNSSGKNTKKVKISIDETQGFIFNCDGDPVPFDASEKEFFNGVLPVISYIEDPTIAKIVNGEVTGLSKGKTNLIICIGVYKLIYPVKVH